jgi:hypothetical protein
MLRLKRSFGAAGMNINDEDLFMKVTGVDEKVHAEKGPLTHLAASVLHFIETQWLYRLESLPARTLLILFSDHGFVENPSFTASRKYETPGYIHGGDSPFEVIVPWAWVIRL